MGNSRIDIDDSSKDTKNVDTESDSNTSKHKLKVFLLDDNRFDAFSTEAFFRSQFEDFDLEFSWANCLPPANKYDSWIEEISKSYAACAIIDHSLSQYKTGIQIVESIRAYNTKLPIILLSGTAQDNPAFENWKERGVNWLVDKNHMDRHFKDISELVAATIAYDASLVKSPN